jgi:hypothetical protein
MDNGRELQLTQYQRDIVYKDKYFQAAVRPVIYLPLLPRPNQHDGIQQPEVAQNHQPHD